jgi:hypothetical protein
MQGHKFYCSQCGWNREIARAALVSAIRISLIVVALELIFAVVVIAKNPGQKWGAAPILLAVSGLPLFWAVFAGFQLRKLNQLSLQPAAQQTNRGVISNATPSLASDPQVMTFSEKKFPELAVIPRPRRLKTTWKGRGYWAFALVVVGLYTLYGLPAAWRGFRIQHSRDVNDWKLPVEVATIYGPFCFFLRNRIRERQLLANGELATGYVTAQSNGRYTQSIDYWFRRSDGTVFTGHCNDASRSLFEGMTVAVFYDAQDPRRSVPLDCAMTTVADS